jgi:hypothetical protein
MVTCTRKALPYWIIPFASTDKHDETIPVLDGLGSLFADCLNVALILPAGTLAPPERGALLTKIQPPLAGGFRAPVQPKIDRK